MAKHFIKKAIKHPGAFSAKAKAAGYPTATYAKMNLHAAGLLGKQARLAYTLEGMHGGGHASMNVAGDKRTAKTKLYQAG